MTTTVDINSAERVLTRVKINLRRREKFAIFSGILSVGTTSIVDDIPTACTDGRNEMYGRKFISELDEKMLAFVILHEACHKLGQDLTTYKALFKENQRLANAACDFRINQMLVDLDPSEQYIAFPRQKDGTRMGLLDPKYKGWSTKEIYNDLKQQQQDGGGGPGNNFDEHDWESGDQLSQEEKQAIAQEIERAIAQGKIAEARAKKAGAGSGDSLLSMQELFKPRVNWRAELSEFVRSQCYGKDTSSWRKPNRRFLSMDVYMPSLIAERVGCVAIGMDTSGSNMSPESVTACMSEIKGILDTVKPEATHLIYWDTQVAGHEVYNDSNREMMLTSTKPIGGGGTDPRCMSKYLKDNHIKPECIIMVTDGELGDTWGNDWEAPILWVVVNRRSYVSPVGKTIHIAEV